MAGNKVVTGGNGKTRVKPEPKPKPKLKKKPKPKPKPKPKETMIATGGRGGKRAKKSKGTA